MTVPPRRSILLTAVLAVLALVMATVGAGADEIGDKQAEADALAGRLADQARTIIALDQDHRDAQERLAQVEAALGQAEAELVAASVRQEDARRLLVAHAQVAYVTGGSTSFVGDLATGAAPDGVARRTYLRFVTGEDRQAIGRMKSARQDVEVRRAELDEIHRRAADQARTVGDDLEELQHAMSAQRAQVEQVDGELAVLVAAEQARVAEAARQEQARRDAEAASARAAQVNVAVPIPYISSGPRATTGPVLSMEEAFACIRQLESGNNYSSGGGGAYQFLDSTWQSLGYDGSAQDHPPAAQDEGARRLQARSGWGQWTTAVYCGLL